MTRGSPGSMIAENTVITSAALAFSAVIISSSPCSCNFAFVSKRIRSTCSHNTSESTVSTGSLMIGPKGKNDRAFVGVRLPLPGMVRAHQIVMGADQTGCRVHFIHRGLPRPCDLLLL